LAWATREVMDVRSTAHEVCRKVVGTLRVGS
jgi:hypothetical protein